jgi:hypothetical protein
MKLKKDFECVLKDASGKVLTTFNAMQVGDPIYAAGFSSGVATSPKEMVIATESTYPFKAGKGKVVIDDKEWVISSVTPSIRRKLGSGIIKKPKCIYILNLE